MAERQAGKAKKRTAKSATVARTVPGQQPLPAAPSSAQAPTQSDIATTEPARIGTGAFEATVAVATLRAVEAERDALKRELEAARARIAELERAREQVLNRIDWVIDSLHNLIEE